MSHAPGNDADDINSDGALNTFVTDMHSVLDEFRENWQRELHADQSEHTSTSEQQSALIENVVSDGAHDDDLCALPSDPEQLQVRAEQLYRKAVELEQRGKVYDALPYYRKAIQIVPDIEFKFYEHQSLNMISAHEANKRLPVTSLNETANIVCKEEAVEINDLHEKFQNDLGADIYGGRLFLSNRDAGVIATELHLADLPPEIIIYIMRWVVSAQLDMRSLEQCAAVCKGFYLCARDEELWHLACVRVWGPDVGELAKGKGVAQQDAVDGLPHYYTWREMFLNRERVLFSGCYISKTTYLRMGENSFQDQYYRPVQLVEYYRYIRFLPEGKALMMTNADEPAKGVNKLKQLNNLRPDVLHGCYYLYGNKVTLVLQKSQTQVQNTQQSFARQRRSSFLHATPEETNSTQYVIEFRILSVSKRKFAQLAWLSYTIVQKRNRVESSSNFDMVPAKYPPLWFSPVRSYHLDADAPLA